MEQSTQVKKFNQSNDPDLKELIKQNEVVATLDLFQDCLNELFDIEFPWLKAGNPVYDRTRERFLQSWQSKGPLEDQGTWVYYPWSKTLIHFPPEDVYIRLRTSRNRNLVTESEQQILNQKTIGIAGMSVGSKFATPLFCHCLDRPALIFLRNHIF